MSRIRKINRTPKDGKNYYIIDSSFLVNRFIPTNLAKPDEQHRIKLCMDWWHEISSQLESNNARVYIPEICIAESFKVLAKKYYHEKTFKTWRSYYTARRELITFIKIPVKELQSSKRKIFVHDIPTTRDLIISIDRFFEIFFKYKCKTVSTPDLLVIATAKFLIDFYDLPKAQVHIVTLDNDLRSGLRKINELPNAYDPTDRYDIASKIFRN